MFTRNVQKEEKKNDSFRLKHFNDTSFLSDTDDCIVWLGHASFFIRLAGTNLLIDPVFFDVAFLKRYSAHAFDCDTFKNIHYLLISHDHQDHCQGKSIRRIVENNPGMQVLTGLNMETLLRPWVKNSLVQVAGWYQQYNTDDGVQIVYLPSRHWSKRGLFDENRRLWGAFVMRSKNKTLYFGGDSGYGSHFREAGQLFPGIDVAILGIGAYKPEWFMHPNHASPTDAVKAFHDTGAEIIVPMHYGTFDISDEPIGEPLRVLRKMEEDSQINGTLAALNPGENFRAF
jgi:L-ascorbate metabolism protein UlaG (beta-lactamase superfamily)